MGTDLILLKVLLNFLSHPVFLFHNLLFIHSNSYISCQLQVCLLKSDTICNNFFQREKFCDLSTMCSYYVGRAFTVKNLHAINGVRFFKIIKVKTQTVLSMYSYHA